LKSKQNGLNKLIKMWRQAAASKLILQVIFYYCSQRKDSETMVCSIQIEEKPALNNPMLIEGLPGIGFVANIVALHLIHELKAKRFARIFSASFQDLAVTTETGEPRSPINELYYYKGYGKSRDLIIWYGNTQALTTFGQYELCGRFGYS
jgi:proteasome assembly chaperone (PAC2) family protein